MPLNDNKQRVIGRPNAEAPRRCDVAAGVHIYKGAIVCDDGTGVGQPAQGSDGAGTFMGIAAYELDNSLSMSPTTGQPLVLEYGQIERIDCADAIVGIANLYAADDGSVTTTKGTNAMVGRWNRDHVVGSSVDVDTLEVNDY